MRERIELDLFPRKRALDASDAFSHADIIPIRATTPQAYSIRFRLYTLEEGASDLEVHTTFIENPAEDLVTVELDDVLVA